MRLRATVKQVASLVPGPALAVDEVEITGTGGFAFTDDAFNPAASSDRAGRSGTVRVARTTASTLRTIDKPRPLIARFSARERALSFVDGLTGALRREAGMMEMERDLARAERTKQPFILVS